MPHPVSRILVINDEPTVLEEFCRELNVVANALDNPLGMVFTGATTAADALDAIERDGNVQAVVVDDKLYGLVPGEGARALQMSALDLVKRINSFRPEVDVYVLIEQDHADEVVDTLFTQAVDGYFYREERDFRGMYRILQAQIQEKARTPFYDALKQYVQLAKDAWHTPGHSSGDSLRESPWVSDFHEFMGEHAFDADLSVSVPMLDSLLDPRGVIAEAQRLAAEAFGAQRTYFATNGTSTSNKVIFQTVLTPGDKLLLDRNCHKSVHHAVLLAGAHPIYLDSTVNTTYGIFGPVTKATLFDAIEAHPDAVALILTSCTYDGLRYDLTPIIVAAHDKSVKVIIDEAWYGFARFHPAFRPTALEAGADYATQSTHKVLSAFSQASMIHVNDPDFDEHVFRENFNMHTSTSPQYAMIASLDVGRKQATMEGYRLLSRALELARELRVQINATGVFRALELEDLLPPELRDDGILLDPTKVTVDISQSGYTVEELEQTLFERFNIQVEKTTFNTLSFLLTIGTTRSKVSRLYDALMRIARERRGAQRQLYRVPEIPRFTALRFLPRDAFYCAGEYVGLVDANEQPNPALLNCVAADQIVPYPPGIPVLVPGQVITAEIIGYLITLLRTQKRIELHGVLHRDRVPSLRVMSFEETQKLTAL